MFRTGHELGHLGGASKGHVFVQAVRQNATARQTLNFQRDPNGRLAGRLDLVSRRFALKAEPSRERLKAVPELGAKIVNCHA